MPNQPIKLPDVEFAMLVELARKDRKSPVQYLSTIINQNYNGKK